METAVKVIWPLTWHGIDLSVTSAVLVIWAAVAIIFTLMFLATRRTTVVPGWAQNLVEITYDFFESQTRDLFGEETGRWLPFIFGLFYFILVCNLLAVVPNVYPITANINVTVTLAVLVFIVYHVAGIRKNGLLNYLRSFLPKGMPIYIMPLLVPIELMSHLARPFSLAVRLFANMTAGHIVTFTLLSLIFVFKNIWLTAIPLLGRITIGLFEIFIAFIQAYVFAYLSALYIGLALAEDEFD